MRGDKIYEYAAELTSRVDFGIAIPRLRERP